MKNIYITLGRNGYISQKIYNHFSNNGEYVFSYEWKSIKNNFFLYPNQINKTYFENDIDSNFNYPINKIFIDCLIGSNDIKSEKILHSHLLNCVKKIYPESIYIFLSTFEPNIIDGTSYRSMKRELENLILKKNGIVVRIANLRNNKNSNFQTNNFITDELFRKIVIPVTYEKDLFKAIKNINRNSTIIKCYKEVMGFSLKLSIPPKIVIQPIKKNKILIPIPFIIICKMLFIFTKILKKFSIKNKFLYFLEKPFSLYVHQLIVNKNENF